MKSLTEALHNGHTYTDSSLINKRSINLISVARKLELDLHTQQIFQNKKLSFKPPSSITQGFCACLRTQAHIVEQVRRTIR